jgi:gliding motility-associated-like protein
MEHHIKIIFFRIILILPAVWCISTTDVAATHIVGGNLTYKHVSGDLYEVKVVLRRDCFLGSPEADFDNPASVGIFTAGGSLAVWLANNGQIRMPFMSSDTLNEFIRSDCGFEGTQVCVHETTYRGLVNLPDRPGGYFLAYQRCCRNGSLNNIIDPLETGSTYWAHVTDEALIVKNSTPEFKAWPDVYICANKPHEFDHSAIDRDGDSLVYKLCVPSLGATKAFPRPQPPGFPPYDNVIWRSPYGLLDMMGGIPLKIDSKTGRITATPNLVGQFLIGICVDEYRNGVKIGAVRRDFQYNVRVCSQPPLARFTTTETNCDGLTVDFFNNSLSASAFEWNFNYPSNDPAFRSTETNPKFTYPSIGTYNVRLRATRGSDGCFDTIIQKVIIFNNKISPDFIFSLSDCNHSSDSLKIQLSDKSVFTEVGYTLNEWNWTVTQNGITKNYTGPNPTASLSFNGDISVTLNVSASNGCRSTISKQINSNDIKPKSDFSIDYPTCPVNDVLKIRLINLSKQQNPYAVVTSTQWTIGALTVSGDTAIVNIPFTNDSISVTMRTAFQGLCTYTFTKKIKLLAPPMADFSLGSEVCGGLNLSFKNNSTNSDTYQWNFNHPSADPIFNSTIKDPSYVYTTSGKYQVQLITTRVADGCRDTIIREVGAYENKINPDFNVLLTNCEQFQDSLRIRLTDISATNEPGQGIVTREWNITQNGITRRQTGVNPEINVTLTGDISVTLQVTSDNGCSASKTKVVKSDDLVPELDFKTEAIGCPRKDTIDLRLINLSAQKNPFSKIQDTKWIIGNRSVTGDSVIVSVPYNASGVSIMLENSFQGNCRKSLVKNIPLTAPALADFNVSSAECSGFNVSFENKSTGAISFEWNFNFPDTSGTFKSTVVNPSFTFSKDGVYKVQLKATKADGCFDTNIKNISVFENNINPKFTTTLNGCDPATDKLSVTLSDISSFAQSGHSINKWEWTVDQNGKITKYTGKSVEILLSYTGNVEITLDIASTNNCTGKKTHTFKIEDFIPKADFVLALVGCPTGEVAEIKLKNLAATLNPFAKIDSTFWVVNGRPYTGDSIIVQLPQSTTTFDVLLTTYLNKECKVTVSRNLSLQNILPKAAYQYKGEECPTDDLVKISLSFVDSLGRNIPLSSIQWQVTIGTSGQTLNGTPVSLNIPKDSLVKLDFTAAFANGCTDRVQTTFLPGPYASVKFETEPLVLCPGESKYLIKNSNPAWTYTWSPLTGLDFTEPKNPKVSVNNNTTYYITVSDGLCTVKDSIQVLALIAGVEIKIDSDNFTCDGNVTLKSSGGIGSGTYTWSKSEDFKDIIGQGVSITSSFTGRKQDYYVKFEGTSCSSKPAKITINNEKPQIIRLSPINLCPLDSNQLITFNDNSTHVNNFVWKNDPHIIRGGNTSRPTILIGPAEKDSFSLYFTATNQFNCSTEDSIKVRIKENPSMNFDVNLKECGKYEVCFKLERTNYLGFVEWDFGDTNTFDDRSLDNAPCYTFKNPGTYNVKLINLTSSCPFIPITKSVIINPQVTLARVRDTTICKGAELTMNASSNLQNVSYEWYDANGKLLFSGQKYSSKYTANTKIVLKAIDIFKCSDTDTINVNVLDFNFNIEAKDSLCINEPSQIKLNIQNPTQYVINWSPANKIVSGGNTTMPTITVSDSIDYKVVLRHIASGCIDSLVFKPKVTKPFVFTVKAPEQLCQDTPTEVTLTITNPSDYTYDWTPKDCVASGGNSINPKIKISKDKTLTVKVTNKVSGCSQSMNVNVKAAAKVDVTIDAIPDLTIFEGESVDLLIKNPINTNKYVWSTGSTNTTIKVSPVLTTTYSATVTDRNGCIGVDQATVTVRNAKCDETDVYLPNAFSPNNDGNNDVFRLRSNFIDEMELIIYNRWGQEIFKTKDDQQGWDGTFKGEELPPDAYAYFLRVICINKEVYTKRGNVNLLR